MPFTTLNFVWGLLAAKEIRLTFLRHPVAAASPCYGNVTLPQGPLPVAQEENNVAAVNGIMRPDFYCHVVHYEAMPYATLKHTYWLTFQESGKKKLSEY